MLLLIELLASSISLGVEATLGVSERTNCLGVLQPSCLGPLGWVHRWDAMAVHHLSWNMVLCRLIFKGRPLAFLDFPLPLPSPVILLDHVDESHVVLIHKLFISLRREGHLVGPNHHWLLLPLDNLLLALLIALVPDRLQVDKLIWVVPSLLLKASLLLSLKALSDCGWQDPQLSPRAAICATSR